MTIHDRLNEIGLDILDPQCYQMLLKEGWVLIVVRQSTQIILWMSPPDSKFKDELAWNIKSL